MKRMRIVTVITTLVVIGIFAGMHISSQSSSLIPLDISAIESSGILLPSSNA